MSGRLRNIAPAMAVAAVAAGVAVGASRAGSATTQPTTGATTRATTQAATSVVLPAEFAILQTRNPFSKGAKKPPASASRGPGAALVLRGIVEADGRFTAVFEEPGPPPRVTVVAAGQPVGPGMAKQIAADGIDYDAGGATRRILVGQNLNGEAAPPPPASKPTAPPPGAAPGPGEPMPPGAVPPGQPRPARGPQPQPAPPVPGQ